MTLVNLGLDNLARLASPITIYIYIHVHIYTYIHIYVSVQQHAFNTHPQVWQNKKTNLKVFSPLIDLTWLNLNFDMQTINKQYSLFLTETSSILNTVKKRRLMETVRWKS